MFKQIIFCFIFLIIFSPSFSAINNTEAIPAESYEKNHPFFKLVDGYFDSIYFPMNPTIASQLGIHSFDDKIENYSKKGIEKKLYNLKNLR